MAKSGCPTPKLCDNRNACLGGCKFERYTDEEIEELLDVALGGDEGRQLPS